MLDPMELPLEVVVIVEVAEDPFLFIFCDLLFSQMPVVDADLGGGGGIFWPLLISLALGRLFEFRGAIAEDGEFSGLVKISPFFRKALLVFPPPSHMKSATVVANASARDVVLFFLEPPFRLLVRDLITVGVSGPIIGEEFSLPRGGGFGRKDTPSNLFDSGG